MEILKTHHFYCKNVLFTAISRPFVVAKENTTQTGGVFFGYEVGFKRPRGYETGERSSLGKRPDRRRWREEGGERSAAVYIFKAAMTAAENIGHRKPGCRNDKGDL